MEIFKNMAIYVEVVRAKSFRHAAEVLGMPNSTVSRRIAELEKAVGLRLLNRTTRTVELTGEGRIYYERCRRIVEEARLAHEALRDMHEQPTGVLRASLPVDFSVVFLAPLLADFARQYPGISFDLDLTPRRANLVSDPVDVAIRVGEQGDPGVISRQIASLSIELYASPAYLEAAGIPRSPEDLLQHQCLRIRAMDWSLYRGESRITLPVTGRFVVNNVGMLRRLSL
ncbi:MAG: LysR substrate-binding domain-containing protein, partial [Azovibrio sp.]